MRQFGKAAAQSAWTDEAADPLTDLQKAMKKVEEINTKKMTDLLKLPEQFIADFNTDTPKLIRKDDPYYIKFEKRRRR